jgi:uncharacterized membrane protein
VKPNSAPLQQAPRAASVLPLFDSVFGVALTLLAFSVPEEVMGGMDAFNLALAIGIYLFSGVAVVLFWFKLRRQIELARQLGPVQAVLGVLSLLVIVLLPRLAELVVRHGGGSGDLRNWTSSQIVNTVFLGALLLMDGVCLAFGYSLLRHQPVRAQQRSRLGLALRIQLAGFLILMVLGVLELALTSFNNQYVLIVPLVLLLEEWLVVRSLARI